MLKQLDMIADPVLHESWDLVGPCTQKDGASYYSEWIQGQNWNLRVRKLSSELISTDRLHYIMSFNTAWCF